MDMVKYTQNGISHPDDDAPDVTIDTISVSGEDERDAEKVMMHVKDEAVRALQALHEEKPPEECEGAPMSVAWDRVFDTDD